ncbi:MAG TPA: 2-phospho-L-lactate guanylyltransferase [Acidimicrobiia bacterium]
MAGVVIIPVKSFSLGKGRLAGAVDPHTRARLGKALAQNVASTVIDAGQMPLIVTAAPDVAEWATKSGLPSLPDPGDGLDMAARTGVDWALHSGSSWLVLHSDLPLIGTSDIEALARPLDAGRDVIAPSADGGTSAIGSRDRVDFSFGVASFHRHLNSLNDPEVVARRGLLLDVDSAGDLQAASTSDRGRWLEEALTRTGPACW